MPFPTMPLEGGKRFGGGRGRDSQLNINAMMDQNGTPNQPAIQRMERLFTILNVDPELIPGIVQLDYSKRDGAPGGGNADYYLGLRPPISRAMDRCRRLRICSWSRESTKRSSTVSARF